MGGKGGELSLSGRSQAVQQGAVEQKRFLGAPCEARGLTFLYVPRSITEDGPSPEGCGLGNSRVPAAEEAGGVVSGGSDRSY